MIGRENFMKKQILYCFATEGERISIKNDNLIIKDGDGQTKLQTTCYRLFAVFVIGDLSLTTAVIKKAKKFGFTIVLMSSTFKTYEVLGFRMMGNTLLNRKQYCYDDLKLANYFICNKIENQILAIKNIRAKSDEKTMTIKNMRKYLAQLYEDPKDIHHMMGIEGVVAKIYFAEMFRDIGWQKRLPRIKPDFINAALDIGYTLLFNYLEAILTIYGFDVYVGFLHKQFYMRKSLVCDFIEPFRPIIDWQVRKSIHTKQFKESDFKVINHKYALKWEQNKKYTKVFAECINENKEAIFLYIQSFYRCFMKDKEIEAYRKYCYGGEP